MIYHITEKSRWERFQPTGVFSAESLKDEGFIHCSTLEQVLGTANRIFQGRNDLVILKIDEELVDHPIVVENLNGGDKFFPHIYGTIPISAILGAFDFLPDSDGCFTAKALSVLF